MTDALCSVDECENPVHARALCMRHYQRQRKTGSVQLRERPSECEAPGCSKPVHGKGACQVHYERMRTRGTYEPLPRKPPTTPRPPRTPRTPKEVRQCEAPGCTRDAAAKNACRIHYTRMRNTGTYEPRPGYEHLHVDVGVWAHGPIIRDSTGFTFAWRCEDHPHECGVDSDSASILRSARDHWETFHPGPFPDGHPIAEETEGREDALSDEAA